MNYNSDYHFHYKGSLNNPAIIFLHGFMGSGNDWSKIIEKLSINFFCVAPDLPGHGKNLYLKSDHFYSITETSEHIISILKFLDIKKSILTGYSMGGRVSLFLGINFPDFFSKILIESSSPGIKIESEKTVRKKNDEKLAYKLETEPFLEFLKKWYSMSLFETINKNLLPSIINRRLKNVPNELAKSLRMSGTGVQESLPSSEGRSFPLQLPGPG